MPGPSRNSPLFMKMMKHGLKENRMREIRNDDTRPFMECYVSLYECFAEIDRNCNYTKPYHSEKNIYGNFDRLPYLPIFR